MEFQLTRFMFVMGCSAIPKPPPSHTQKKQYKIEKFLRMEITVLLEKKEREQNLVVLRINIIFARKKLHNEALVVHFLFQVDCVGRQLTLYRLPLFIFEIAFVVSSNDFIG